jgi:hypothetical protein
MALRLADAPRCIWFSGLIICLASLFYVDFNFYLQESEDDPAFRSPMNKAYSSVATIYGAYAGVCLFLTATAKRSPKRGLALWAPLVIAVVVNGFLIALCLMLSCFNSILLQRFLELMEPNWLTILGTTLGSIASASESPRSTR